MAESEQSGSDAGNISDQDILSSREGIERAKERMRGESVLHKYFDRQRAEIDIACIPAPRIYPLDEYVIDGRATATTRDHLTWIHFDISDQCEVPLFPNSRPPENQSLIALQRDDRISIIPFENDTLIINEPTYNFSKPRPRGRSLDEMVEAARIRLSLSLAAEPNSGFVAESDRLTPLSRGSWLTTRADAATGREQSLNPWRYQSTQDDLVRSTALQLVRDPKYVATEALVLVGIDGFIRPLLGGLYQEGNFSSNRQYGLGNTDVVDPRRAAEERYDGVAVERLAGAISGVARALGMYAPFTAMTGDDIRLGEDPNSSFAGHKALRDLREAVRGQVNRANFCPTQVRGIIETGTVRDAYIAAVAERVEALRSGKMKFREENRDTGYL